MAERFPHVQVHAVDLRPAPQDLNRIPRNVQFEMGEDDCFPPSLGPLLTRSTDDINLGLSHFHDYFDVVHMRCVNGGVNNIQRTLYDLNLCLKPGGVLIWIGGDIEILDKDRRKLKMARVEGDSEDATRASDEGSWFQRMIWGKFLIYL